MQGVVVPCFSASVNIPSLQIFKIDLPANLPALQKRKELLKSVCFHVSAFSFSIFCGVSDAVFSLLASHS